MKKYSRNRTLLDCFKNQYNKNEIFTFKKYQNSFKSKVPMTPKMTPSELLAIKGL